MNNEIEVKVLEVDRNSIERKLITLGAKKTFDDLIDAEIFDTYDYAIVGKKDCLRLRKEGPRAVLVYKEFISADNVKSLKEYEVEVSDHETMRCILEHLGLKPISGARKHRISYSLDGVHFDFDKPLDEHAYIPEYLEIEAHDTETVYAYAEKLGIGRSDCLPWTFSDVKIYYQNKLGR